MASVDLKLSTAQKQLLSQQMLQSLQILQMSAAELESYIENLALENPVIELTGRETHTDRTEQMELQRKLDWLSSVDPQNHVYYQSERDAEDPENNWQDLRASEETLEDYLRAQLLRMIRHLLCQIHAADAGNAGIVINLISINNLAAVDKVLLDQDIIKLRAGSIDGGGQSRGPRTDDNQIMHINPPYPVIHGFSQPDQTFCSNFAFMAALGIAPTTSSTTWPPLKNFMFGILMILY